MPREKITLRVNGRRRRVRVDPDEPLLWVLRDRLRLTGTKFGCGEGVCGSCSVLIDGEARRSCMIPVGSITRRQRIVTIEGLDVGGGLTPLQHAFLNHNAFCCGFCTPGMIINATALLNSNPNPDRQEIIDAMQGNLCRCASYLNVIEAIESLTAAAAQRKGS